MYFCASARYALSLTVKAVANDNWLSVAKIFLTSSYIPDCSVLLLSDVFLLSLHLIRWLVQNYKEHIRL